MFDKWLKEKAVVAKDAAVESLKDDIRNDPNIGTGVVVAGVLLLTMVLSSLITGKAPSASTQQIINNIYINKELIK